MQGRSATGAPRFSWPSFASYQARLGAISTPHPRCTHFTHLHCIHSRVVHFASCFQSTNPLHCDRAAAQINVKHCSQIISIQDRRPRQQWETGDHWWCSRQWTVNSSTTVSSTSAGCCKSWQDKVHSGLHVRDFRLRLEWETLLVTAVHITMLLLIINQSCKSGLHTEIQHH